MILYLCRHAAAEDPAPGQSDADRALTSEGTKKFRAAARGFLSLDPDISHILTSPLLRARQTAEILAETFDADKQRVELLITKSLGAAPNLKTFLAETAKLKSPRNLVAVGHEPTLSAWLAELCFQSPGPIEFKKGAIAALDLHRPRATLLFLLQPAHLRALA